MSTKATIFLTNDDEHCYEEVSESHYKDGRFMGNTIVLEMSKKNINILVNDDDCLIIELINPESELYKRFAKMNILREEQ